MLAMNYKYRQSAAVINEQVVIIPCDLFTYLTIVSMAVRFSNCMDL